MYKSSTVKGWDMNRLWHQYSPLFHIAGLIITMVFTAGVVWANASKYENRIADLEKSKDQQAKILTRMDYNIQIIGRKVGVKPLEKEE